MWEQKASTLVPNPGDDRIDAEFSQGAGSGVVPVTFLRFSAIKFEEARVVCLLVLMGEPECFGRGER